MSSPMPFIVIGGMLCLSFSVGVALMDGGNGNGNGNGGGENENGGGENENGGGENDNGDGENGNGGGENGNGGGENENGGGENENGDGENENGGGENENGGGENENGNGNGGGGSLISIFDTSECDPNASDEDPARTFTRIETEDEYGCFPNSPGDVKLFTPNSLYWGGDARKLGIVHNWHPTIERWDINDTENRKTIDAGENVTDLWGNKMPPTYTDITWRVVNKPDTATWVIYDTFTKPS